MQYASFDDSVGFLPVKQAYHDLWYWKAAFYVHVFTSLFALGAGFTQFFEIRSARLARIHRIVGRISATAILLLAAPSGLVLAFYAEGGKFGRLGFVMICVLWFVTTGLGCRMALQKNILKHQAWMTRSFALTFSAVTLREWQHWLLLFFPDFDNDPWAPWIGFLPNLIVAEAWLRLGNRSSLEGAAKISSKNAANPG